MGAVETAEMVMRNFWWPGVTREIKRYIEGCCQRANSELELSQLLFISVRQRELVRVLASLVSSTYTYSTWSVHLLFCTPNQTMCDMFCNGICDMTFDVTLSLLLSHGMTCLSHAINRKRYLKEKKNRDGLLVQKSSL